MWLPWRRKRARLRQIGEAEAYGRTYGDRTPDVRIVAMEPRRPRYRLRVSGEDLRRQFEQKLLGRVEKEKVTES
jgi:hypothetical protein